MKRYDFEIGGYVFLAFMVLAVVLVLASIVGHVLQFFGWV